MYVNYSLERGLASEAAVEKLLTQLRGKPLIERRKKLSLRARIINFISARPNDALDRSHADFLVTVESDVNGGMISIPLQTKSSARAGMSFKRKCRLNGWGPIQVVVVEDDDTEETLMSKIISALIEGYNQIRREFSNELWRFRASCFAQQHIFPGTPHYAVQQWCPRFNFARRCWH